MIHSDLAAGRWQKLSLAEQMSNIGSEAERAIKWKKFGKRERFNSAFTRLIELLELTQQAGRRPAALKEVSRIKECLIDYLFGENIYQSTAEAWQKYFFPFNILARKEANRQ